MNLIFIFGVGLHLGWNVDDLVCRLKEGSGYMLPLIRVLSEIALGIYLCSM